VAAAIGTPSVGIFGPTRPHLTGPLNPVLAVEPAPGICATCGRRDCPRLDHRRTDDIPVDAVLAAVRRALGTSR
jgi:ADP-heptose:LPS heptosyltransferase